MKESADRFAEYPKIHNHVTNGSVLAYVTEGVRLSLLGSPEVSLLVIVVFDPPSQLDLSSGLLNCHSPIHRAT